ncbi:deaminase [Alkalihalobacillus alcalophilus ATCC 27647 = CGMCC 1.3604]|uniref:Amidohydrolase n=1 Tax=Alkalihalobacillus alcalophilus ATCC 27647 = CGMCC 1.3604 TaxID=1218173 RepID=A0A094WDZ7_ALKAL|nr:amidohydrolase family protein [Alkalihalobacillus alcalophilus]KGA95979.1 amidohydrolase [Alkalihalobacillus alcalophilus ATCC 27647 = CGMCC 1.3604]MED1562078.1 amidohydrolase family protein [Alkalihalobacillus alcalophilus]THG88289.1 deaminase [Alkalihalobacillus alcalophilus ATCC 27647 = CGMCC 1.3604]
MKTHWKQVKIGEHLYRLEMENGFFTAVERDDSSLGIGERGWNAKGLLYLPTLSDRHCHLDKHFIGETWRSRTAIDTLPNHLRREKELLASLQGDVLERARTLLNIMLRHGTTKIRTHVDIDPTLGLAHLEAILQVREEFKDSIEFEIVAFPQQGLIRSKSIDIMKEAMQMGADLVGAVDPGGLDHQIESCLAHVFELATQFNKGVDVHLHDPGHLGLYTIDRMMDKTEQARLQGRVAVSHAYCLGQVTESESRELAERLKEQRVAIISNVPIDRPMPNVPQLAALGVDVQIGTDNVLDSWSPFGDGDMLRRMNRLAERFQWIEDDQLLGTYRFATKQSLVPRVGAPADFMLVSAMNLEHAVASVPPREFVVVAGKLVYEKEQKVRAAYERNHQL